MVARASVRPVPDGSGTGPTLIDWIKERGIPRPAAPLTRRPGGAFSKELCVMWSFLTRNRSAARTRTKARTRLSLELLEHRDCPSGVTIDSFVVEPTGYGTQVELYGSPIDADSGT